MDKAKAAVSSFLSKDGKHDTTVHERVNPAVEQERIHRQEQEEAQKVIDREVHQDHFHTSVQPIQHKEVLPEQHSHTMAPVEHREYEHGNSQHVKERIAAEAAQFKNTREMGEVSHTQVAAPTVAGEHVHHHVHETIQPVIQKETIQPSVVHTTIPVHEVHHNEAKHHQVSALPTMTMDEFTRQGGSLSGREERSDAFAGEPRAVGSAVGQGQTIGGPGAAGSTTVTDGSATGHHHHNHGATTGGTTEGTSSSTSGTGKKASLLDKLNPMKDTDGDGKKGIMD